MSTPDLLEFLEEPFTVEIDSLRDSEHTQSIVIERDSFTVEFDVLVTTKECNSFGSSGITSAYLTGLHVRDERLSRNALANDLIYHKIDKAVELLIE